MAAKSVNLDSMTFICEELGIKYIISDRHENDPTRGKFLICPNNEGDYISVKYDTNKYYFSIGYFKGYTMATGYYTKNRFTDTDLRSLLQIIAGQPLYQVDDSGDLHRFFLSLN